MQNVDLREVLNSLQMGKQQKLAGKKEKEPPEKQNARNEEVCPASLT